MRLLIVTDPHYPGWELHGWTADERYQMMVSEINKEAGTKVGLDACVIGGDLVGVTGDMDSDYLYHVRDTHLCDLNIPYYPVHGNHDCATESVWQDVFGMSKNYSAVIEDFGLIFLDTYSDEAGYTDDFGYAYSGINNAWLETKLAEFAALKDCFIFCHFYITDPITEALIEGSNVRAIFCGHNHLADFGYSEVKHYRCGHWSMSGGGSWNNDNPYSYHILQSNHFKNEVFNFHVFPEILYPYGLQERVEFNKESIVNGTSEFVTDFEWASEMTF